MKTSHAVHEIATEHSVQLALSSIVLAFVSFVFLNKKTVDMPDMRTNEDEWKDLFYSYFIGDVDLPKSMQVLAELDTYKKSWAQVAEVLEYNGTTESGRWKLTQLRLAEDWVREVPVRELEILARIAQHMDFFRQ